MFGVPLSLSRDSLLPHPENGPVKPRQGKKWLCKKIMKLVFSTWAFHPSISPSLCRELMLKMPASKSFSGANFTLINLFNTFSVSLQHQNSITNSTGTKGLIIIPILFDRQTVSGWLASLLAGWLSDYLSDSTSLSVFSPKPLLFFV